MYAKNKNNQQVKERSESPVDRLSVMFPKKSLSFNFKKDNVGKFNYQVLMNNPKAEFIPEIAKKYKEVSSKLNFNSINDEKLKNYFAVFEQARLEVLGMEYDNSVILDTIIIDLFYRRKTATKKAFWILFGDMVYENVIKNIEYNYVQCPKCKTRFYKEHKGRKYCDKCQSNRHAKKLIINNKCVDCGKPINPTETSRQLIRCEKCYAKYREYQKQPIQIKVCCDCGKEFELKGNNRQNNRCSECYKNYRKDAIKTNAKKWRNKR